MGIDLSELKQTQDALRESETFYRVLAERMTVGAMLCQSSKIVFANDALLSIFGYREASDLVGKDIGELVSREFEMYFREMFDVLEKRFSEQRSFETRCRTKAGREIWIQGRASLIQWKGLPTVFMTARDITEAKERELSMLEEAEHLRRENISLRSSIKDRYRLGSIIGKSPAMQEVYELILNAAATNANVIVYGDSGTGKELVARAIHDMSSRSEKEFVPVNCAAIPGESAGKRVLRSQERGLYRRPCRQTGVSRPCGRGHIVPRRGGRVGTHPSGKDVASHRGWRLFPGGEQCEQALRFSHHRCHESEPPGTGQEKRHSGGLLLQDSRHTDKRSPLARPQGRHSAPDGALSQALFRERRSPSRAGASPRGPHELRLARQCEGIAECDTDDTSL